MAQRVKYRERADLRSDLQQAGILHCCNGIQSTDQLTKQCEIQGGSQFSTLKQTCSVENNMPNFVQIGLFYRL